MSEDGWGGIPDPVGISGQKLCLGSLSEAGKAYVKNDPHTQNKEGRDHLWEIPSTLKTKNKGKTYFFSCKSRLFFVCFEGLWYLPEITPNSGAYGPPRRPGRRKVVPYDALVIFTLGSAGINSLASAGYLAISAATSLALRGGCAPEARQGKQGKASKAGKARQGKTLFLVFLFCLRVCLISGRFFSPFFLLSF